MSYPIQSLAIIAPITLLVLLIIIPLIGVFAGWKRAAYWGGGTFFFFLVGMIVWKTAGLSISSKFTSLIAGMVPAGTTITPQLVQSIVAPVFFLAVMIVAELLLLINYYAWFKRVAKIKRDVKLRKEMKAAKKAGTKLPKIEQSGWSQLQFTTKGKVINKVCGGAGLALLMVPSTITFTQAIYYLTTNSATRQNNKFSAGLYNTLQNVSGAFSWMSYYNGKQAGTDCDSLMSVLGLYTTQYTYTTLDENGNEIPGSGDGVTAFGSVMGTGFAQVITQAKNGSEATTIESSINQFAGRWNDLLDKAGTSIEAVFQSETVAETVKSIFKEQVKSAGSTITISSTDLQTAFGTGSAFEKIYEDYTKEGSTIDHLDQIHVSEKTYNILVETVESMITPQGFVEGDAETLNKWISNVIGLMFTY